MRLLREVLTCKPSEMGRLASWESALKPDFRSAADELGEHTPEGVGVC